MKLKYKCLPYQKIGDQVYFNSFWIVVIPCELFIIYLKLFVESFRYTPTLWYFYLIIVCVIFQVINDRVGFDGFLEWFEHLGEKKDGL
jgi:hypothetical protein